ncbi:MAG: hypothetical protein LBR38_02025 [Synergistaceae bacterium]|jgi:hypothetical protein|nr:hypothetical protein [Synergistaceae bacterium]
MRFLLLLFAVAGAAFAMGWFMGYSDARNGAIAEGLHKWTDSMTLNFDAIHAVSSADTTAGSSDAGAQRGGNAPRDKFPNASPNK